MSADGVLDTNAVLLLGRLDPADLPLQPVVTTVTLAELSVGPLVTDDLREQAARQVRLQATEANFDALPFDLEAARTYGAVASQLRQAGPKSSPRAFDALIAATAMSRGLPLYTCNPRGFEGIEGLEVVAVPHPDAS